MRTIRLGPTGFLFIACASVGCLNTVVPTTPIDPTGQTDKSTVVPGGTVDHNAWDALCKQLGQAANCDLCASYGWYGDGVCDTFCPSPDPDCGGTSTGESPYHGTAAAIPGTIEAEDYDLGGEGVAYHDSDATNTLAQGNPSVDRGDGVDLKTCTDTTGCGAAVGTFAAGEWLNYTVDVATAGAYEFSARAATTVAAVTFHLELDGDDVSGAIAVPVNETNWDGGWETVTAIGIDFPAGTHVLRVLNDSGYFDLNDFTLSSTSAVTPPIPAPAQAAGFTTLAANYDFSTSFYTTQSNWLGCQPWDGKTHQWYQGNGGSCSHISQQFDPVAGQNVLDLRYTPSDYNSNYYPSNITALMTANWVGGSGKYSLDANGYPVARTDYPMAYFEITYRATSVTPSAPYSGFVTPSAMVSFWTYPYDGDISAGKGAWELDIPEYDFSYGSSYLMGNIAWAGSGPSSFQVSAYNSGLDLTEYHTWGELLTGNANEVAVCPYLDGQPVGQCVSSTNTTFAAAIASARHSLILWSGLGDCNNGHANNGSPENGCVNNSITNVYQCSAQGYTNKTCVTLAHATTYAWNLTNVRADIEGTSGIAGVNGEHTIVPISGGSNNDTNWILTDLAWPGGTYGGGGTWNPYSQIDQWIKSIRVWSCATWETGQCNGTAITTGIAGSN